MSSKLNQILGEYFCSGKNNVLQAGVLRAWDRKKRLLIEYEFTDIQVRHQATSGKDAPCLTAPNTWLTR